MPPADKFEGTLTLKASLGGPGPDGFHLTIKKPNGSFNVVFISPEAMREFWAQAGVELDRFDEMAGEPSS